MIQHHLKGQFMESRGGLGKESYWKSGAKLRFIKLKWIIYLHER